MKIQDYNPSTHIYFLLCAVAVVLCLNAAWWLALLAGIALLAAGKQLILLIQQGWFFVCDVHDAYEYRKYEKRVRAMK